MNFAFWSNNFKWLASSKGIFTYFYLNCWVDQWRSMPSKMTTWPRRSPDVLQKTPEAVKLRSLVRVDDAAFGVRLASPHSQTSQVKKRMPSIRGIPLEFGNLTIKETNCRNPRKWKLCFLMIRYDKYCMRMRPCARLPVTCCTMWPAKVQWTLKPVKFPSTQMCWSCWFG